MYTNTKFINTERIHFTSRKTTQAYIRNCTNTIHKQYFPTLINAPPIFYFNQAPLLQLIQAFVPDARFDNDFQKFKMIIKMICSLIENSVHNKTGFYSLSITQIIIYYFIKYEDMIKKINANLLCIL